MSIFSSTLLSRFSSRCSNQGFTLTETLMASAISLLILSGAILLFTNTFGYWHGVNLRMDADREANRAMNRIVYGMRGRLGLRAAASEDTKLTKQANGSWTLDYVTGSIIPQTNQFKYLVNQKEIRFNPGNYRVAQDVSQTWIDVKNGALMFTVRVDKVVGREHARREVGTRLEFRNE